jgi:serine/threonine-protein kinase
MEFVAGVNLRQIRGRVGDVPWVLGVLRQVASALEVLHGSAIVHRDLKPENILVVLSDNEGIPMVKLADFGISIINDNNARGLSWNSAAFAETLGANSSRGKAPVEREATLTQTGVLVGTPLYMAPELAYGSKKAPSSSDMFSFGVIAYELLAGARPYSFPPVLGGFVHDDVRDRLRRCAALSEDLVELFARCLDAEPEKRPGAGEIAQRIAAGVQD